MSLFGRSSRCAVSRLQKQFAFPPRLHGVAGLGLCAFGSLSGACHEGRSAEAPPALDATVDVSVDASSEAVSDASDAASDASGLQADSWDAGLPPDFTGPSLCLRQADDSVRDVFCRTDDASVRSLRELQVRLMLTTIPLTVSEAQMESVKLAPDALVDGVVYLGHSTALAGQIVSPINPRAVLLGYQTFMAFQRGVQQVELIAIDRETAKFNFYLLTFNQACNDKAAGCVPGDLYTPSVERDWTAVALRDDEDLKNAPEDCRQCHQRARAQPSVLLMRELRGPWTHFFGQPFPAESSNGEVSGGDLVADYNKAKSLETYAGLPAAVMEHTAGGILQARIVDAQPLDFDTPTIEAELIASEASTLRRSATWDLAYQAFKRGEQLALPHFEPRPTDPDKQAKLSAAYAKYRAKEMPAEALPDLADIFPDDPKVRAELGLQTEPGATPAQALVQACAPCHNDVLDQTLSRARFSIALSRMSREELDLAIARLELAKTDPITMPPRGNRQLDEAGRKRLISYLRENKRSAEDDALLETAAQVGMAKERAAFPRN